MLIRVDAAAATPPYEQVRAQLAALVRSGSLLVGTRLPTVRRLAEDLGLAVNTVARSYKELEADGVIETRGRHGTFVAALTDAQREAAEAAAAYVERVRRLGISDEEAARLIATALNAGLTSTYADASIRGCSSGSTCTPGKLSY
ncbi:GntR family transcriptional regulator [Actinospica robiniae]|uniref:GntR family transcriptional regulator n=1 Tax=Actinospica robiniae TaxID=304901 RepID=UPI000688FBD3|nr:GntR family transcriptional regulator [Actinospica robiniae]